jgi:hypothetical protein
MNTETDNHSSKYVTFEVYTAVAMKNVFWNVSQCGSCRNGRFGGAYRLHLLRSVLESLAIANVFWFIDCFHPEDGGDTFLQNVGSYENHTATHPRRRHSSTKQGITKFVVSILMYCSDPFYVESDYNYIYVRVSRCHIPEDDILYRYVSLEFN